MKSTVKQLVEEFKLVSYVTDTTDLEPLCVERED